MGILFEISPAKIPPYEGKLSLRRTSAGMTAIARKT